jgi:hypothetical protein
MSVTAELKPIAPYVGQIVGYVEIERERARSQAADYSEFSHWHAMLVGTNREEKAAEWLREKIGLVVYWPNFPVLTRLRGKLTHQRLRSMLPSLMFAPTDMLFALPRRDEVLRHAHVYGFIPDRVGRVRKADIERIRELEAKLNLPSPQGKIGFRIGQQVCFVNALYRAFLGTALVFEVASRARIGVEVQKLFGRVTRMYVPASEIEPVVADEH